MPDKPWLGAQEAHYASLLWHLDVPDDYTSQVDATRSVFPGKAMVNVAAPPATHAAVDIRGFAKAWITDMECATSFRPKMYGFDFGRVTEAFLNNNGKKRLVVEKEPAERALLPGLPGERAMMKDLMLSTMLEGGEVCMTHHTLNPFLPKINREVQGDEIGAMLSLRRSSSLGVAGNAAIAGKDLGAFDFATNNDAAISAARSIIQHNAVRLGAFLNEVLESEHSNGKNIWLRLLHEPNIGYFWWGQPEGADPDAYYSNFAHLWNFMVTNITAQIDNPLRSRLKLVFSINGEKVTNNLIVKLNKHFPGAVSPAPETHSFMQSLAVLGLDYYEDWARIASDSQLPAQYQAVKAKAAEVKLNHDLSWEHALTEVSVRSGSKGKLYGKYGSHLAWVPSKIEDSMTLPNRTFFDEIVYELVKTEDPKWVLFWVNRVGNAILSSFEPTTSQTANGMPELYYHARTNVFTDPNAELYFPIFPAEPFVVETFKAGDETGTKAFFPISQTDQIPNLPGGGTGADLANHVDPYKDAILDFFRMVPPTRKLANTAKIIEVEKFLCEPTLPRPTIDPAPTSVQKAELLFEVL